MNKQADSNSFKKTLTGKIRSGMSFSQLAQIANQLQKQPELMKKANAK